MKKVNSPTSLFCSHTDQTISHLFWICDPILTRKCNLFYFLWCLYVARSGVNPPIHIYSSILKQICSLPGFGCLHWAATVVRFQWTVDVVLRATLPVRWTRIPCICAGSTWIVTLPRRRCCKRLQMTC